VNLSLHRACEPSFTLGRELRSKRSRGNFVDREVIPKHHAVITISSLARDEIFDHVPLHSLGFAFEWIPPASAATTMNEDFRVRGHEEPACLNVSGL